MSRGKARGLFLNTALARCSIYESGRMAYQSLLNSSEATFTYQEIDADHREISLEYDLFVFNYHDLTSMSWLDTQCIRELPGTKICLVLEVGPNNPFARVSEADFDAYTVLDPTVGKINSKVYPFPRPLEVVAAGVRPAPAGDIPTIGTFWLPTAGKGFDKDRS